MAEDLSQTLQEGIAQTLSELLGIDTKFLETTKADRRDIQTSQLLEVNSEFEFDKLTTELQFIIPSNSASIIFNTMMGTPDYEIATEIDEDTIDAMGEFISNISGSLVTAFNAQELENLGKAKFHIKHKETLEGGSLEEKDNLFRFVIELDEKPLTVFMRFHEEFLPYIQTIANAAPTEYPEEEEPVVEEANEIEEIEDIKKEETPITNNKEDTEKTEEDSEIKDEEPELSEEEEASLKKQKKLKYLIIGIGSLLAIVLIVFSILFFTGSDEEENMDQNNSQAATDINESVNEEFTTKAVKTLKKIDFKITDIDIERLNGRLATLTKYDVLTKEELAEQKEQERLYLAKIEKEKPLIEFAKMNKEEPLQLEKNIEKEEVKKEMPPKETEMVQEKTPDTTVTQSKAVKEETIESTPVKAEISTAVSNQKEAPEEPTKLKYLSSAQIKYTLFRNLISQLNSQSARIAMCNDDIGRTTIFIGPFKDKEEQVKMENLIKNTDGNIILNQLELTQEELDKRCN